VRVRTAPIRGAAARPEETLLIEWPRGEAPSIGSRMSTRRFRSGNWWTSPKCAGASSATTRTSRDWGFVGPILGPFQAVHFTYKEHIRCIADAETGAEIELGFHDDMLVHDGKFYGDFEICGGHDPE
jgi:hypothetical protein